MPPDFSFDNLLTNLAGDRFTNKPLQNTEFVLAGTDSGLYGLFARSSALLQKFFLVE